MAHNINFYAEIDTLRKNLNISTAELTDGIMSERTYYRHLGGEVGIKYTSLQALLTKLNLDLPELIVQDAIYKDNDENLISKFVYRLYTLQLNDIKPILNRLEKYQTENLLLQKFVEINILKYRYITKSLPRSAYSKLLRKALSDLTNVKDTNVYKLYINMESFILDYKAKSRKLNKVHELVLKNDFSKNPLYSIIIFDNYLNVLIKHQLLPLEELMILYKKYRGILKYFNILRPFTKLDLYRAYIEKYSNNEILMKKYLIKYINGIIVTDGGKFIHDELAEVKQDFGIDYKRLLNDNKDLVFNNPDSRFRIVKELEIEHKEIKETKN